MWKDVRRPGYAIPRPPEETWSYKRGFDLSDPWAQRAMCFGQSVNMLIVCVWITLNISSVIWKLSLLPTIAPSAEVWILQVSYPGSDDHKAGCSVLFHLSTRLASGVIARKWCWFEDFRNLTLCKLQLFEVSAVIMKSPGLERLGQFSRQYQGRFPVKAVDWAVVSKLYVPWQRCLGHVLRFYSRLQSCWGRYSYISNQRNKIYLAGGRRDQRTGWFGGEFRGLA